MNTTINYYIQHLNHKPVIAVVIKHSKIKFMGCLISFLFKKEMILTGIYICLYSYIHTYITIYIFIFIYSSRRLFRKQICNLTCYNFKSNVHRKLPINQNPNKNFASQHETIYTITVKVNYEVTAKCI